MISGYRASYGAKNLGTNNVAGTSVPNGGLREGCYSLPNQSRWHLNLNKLKE